MIRLTALVLTALLTGCATLETIGDIADILTDPVPVCDRDSVGVTVEGRQCVKFSDGSYEWRRP